MKTEVAYWMMKIAEGHSATDLFYLPSMKKLMETGMFDDAVNTFEKWTTSDFAHQLTDEDWIKLTGSRENFERLFEEHLSRLGRLDVELKPDDTVFGGLPPEVETAINTFIDTANVESTMSEWQANIVPLGKLDTEKIQQAMKARPDDADWGPAAGKASSW